MIITHNLQYPPTPDSATNTTNWSATAFPSTNAGVPAGCPYSYVIQAPQYDARINPIANWLPSRLGSFVELEVMNKSFKILKKN